MGQLHTTNFAAQPNGALVSAGGVVVDGWIARGSTTQQLGGLLVPTNAGSWVVRPHTEDSTTGIERVEGTAVYNNGDISVGVRIDDTGAGYCSFIIGGSFFIGTIGGWGFNGNLASANVTIPDGTTSLTIKFSCDAAGNLASQLLDSSGNVLATLAATNTTYNANRGIGIGVAYGAATPGFTSATTHDSLTDPLTFGYATFASATPTTVTVNVAGWTGGTTPLTYQWQTSADGQAGWADVAGATTATATITPPDGSDHWYRCNVTDATPLTQASTPCLAFTNAPAIVLLGIGDSKMAIKPDGVNTPLDYMAVALKPLLTPRSISVVNRAIPGTQTTVWQPGDASNYLVAAVAAGVAASATDAWCDLMVNDTAGGSPRTAAQWKANVAAIAAYIKAQGIPNVWWSYSSYYANNPANDDLMVQYQAALNQLAAAGIVRLGTKQIYRQFAANAAAWLVDFLHPTLAGAQNAGAMWAAAFASSSGSAVSAAVVSSSTGVFSSRVA